MKTTTDTTRIQTTLREGSRRMAPLWSLENFVAVNPFLGMADMRFEKGMQFLSRTSDAQVTLPVSYYMDALKDGRLQKADIQNALMGNAMGLSEDADVFIQELFSARERETSPRVKTLADVASEVNGKKWLRFKIDRISFWASAYFDRHQAIWKTSDPGTSIFAAWKREAEVDYAPEAMGLKGFRAFVKSLPTDYLECAALALDELDIREPLRAAYLSALLMRMNGWAGFTARIDWDAGLAGQDSDSLQQFLAILLIWELALFKLLPYRNLSEQWQHAKRISHNQLADPEFEDSLVTQLVLQKAFDLARQRILIEKINGQSPTDELGKKAIAQAIFCIDVRSEAFRRNLEAANGDIETLGFAGFFGFPIKHVPLGHMEGTDQCPVLIPSSHVVKESLNDPNAQEKAVQRRNRTESFLKAWKSFKTGAVSCFGFVSPLGLYFLPKLFTDLFGLTRPVPHPHYAGLSKSEIAMKGISMGGDASEGIQGIALEDRLAMAKGALTAMSLTESFAPLVLIAGHGATTVNNPHATGLDCGACGGHSGEANAKVAAAILNDPEVRKGLNLAGIQIPEETLFVAGLHDTTTDQLTLFGDFDSCTDEQKKQLGELRRALEIAGELTRKERAPRMKISGENIDSQVLHRSKDWSQVRPEWGLAGCSSFVVAPRKRTSQLNLEGKTFMHSYNWQKDENFGVLEVIMTAPMVVTSWINLQYYASTVDNKRFGAGNKALHNVVGGLGVLEGFAGDLRVGLPWQSVHDGEKFQNEPNRLNVFIEAPLEAMSTILGKHEGVRQLCDHEWIFLFAIDKEGKVSHKYGGNLEWVAV